MEEILKQLLEGQKQITRRLDSMEKGQEELKEEVSIIKGQQAENTQIIKGIMHNSEILNAKIDGITVNTVSKEAFSNLATKEDISDINSHLKALNDRLFHQEAAINHLKAVK